jgi:hypothetical protein
MCAGQFSAETVALLREAYEREGWSASETFATYPCAVCGRVGLLAKNHMGVWHPESHDPLPRKRVNPSGKSGYYKR